MRFFPMIITYINNKLNSNCLYIIFIMSALSGFNNVLLKFVKKIVRWYPEQTDLVAIKTGVETFKKYNPRLILDQFMGYIGPYYVKIFNKDEQFFSDLNNMQQDPNFQAIEDQGWQESVMVKMGVFKDLWHEMPDDRKKYVWKMFGALLKVGALASNEQAYEIILQYVDSNPQLFSK
jgi:hypothetical protein